MTPSRLDSAQIALAMVQQMYHDAGWYTARPFARWSQPEIAAWDFIAIAPDGLPVEKPVRLAYVSGHAWPRSDVTSGILEGAATRLSRSVLCQVWRLHGSMFEWRPLPDDGSPPRVILVDVERISRRVERIRSGNVNDVDLGLEARPRDGTASRPMVRE